MSDFGCGRVASAPIAWAGHLFSGQGWPFTTGTNLRAGISLHTQPLGQVKSDDDYCVLSQRPSRYPNQGLIGAMPWAAGLRLHHKGRDRVCWCAHSRAGGIRLANAKVEGRAGWSVGFAQALDLAATECVVWGLPGPP